VLFSLFLLEAIMKAKVLVVDDDRMMRELVKSFLLAIGFLSDNITLTDSVEEMNVEVWSLIQEGQFDLIITDCHMPEIRGDEFVHRLKDAGMITPVLLISGLVSDVNVGGKFHSANVVLAKPFDYDVFRTAVQGLITAPVAA